VRLAGHYQQLDQRPTPDLLAEAQRLVAAARPPAAAPPEKKRGRSLFELWQRASESTIATSSATIPPPAVITQRRQQDEQPTLARQPVVPTESPQQLAPRRLPPISVLTQPDERPPSSHFESDDAAGSAGTSLPVPFDSADDDLPLPPVTRAAGPARQRHLPLPPLPELPITSSTVESHRHVQTHTRPLKATDQWVYPPPPEPIWSALRPDRVTRQPTPSQNGSMMR
jgi:hypothetical protein